MQAQQFKGHMFEAPPPPGPAQPSTPNTSGVSGSVFSATSPGPQSHHYYGQQGANGPTVYASQFTGDLTVHEASALANSQPQSVGGSALATTFSGVFGAAGKASTGGAASHHQPLQPGSTTTGGGTAVPQQAVAPVYCLVFEDPTDALRFCHATQVGREGGGVGEVAACSMQSGLDHASADLIHAWPDSPSKPCTT